MSAEVTREAQAAYHDTQAVKADAETHEFAKNNAAIHRFRAWVLRQPNGTQIPMERRRTPCECHGCVYHDFRCTSGPTFTYEGRILCKECYRHNTKEQA